MFLSAAGGGGEIGGISVIGAMGAVHC